MSLFADPPGAYMGWEWIDSSYAPFARIAERSWREQEGHAQLRYEIPRDVCAAPAGRQQAQEKLISWYPAGLDMLGRSDSERQYDHVRWGLRRLTNEEMREAFRQEVDAVLRAVGLEPPDPLANRRYL